MSDTKYRMIKFSVSDGKALRIEHFSNKREAISFAKHLSGGYFNREIAYRVINLDKRETVWESKH